MPRIAKFKKSLKYTHLSMLDSELGSKIKQFIEKRKELEELKKEIKSAFQTTETGKIAMAMTGNTGYRSSNPILPAIYFAEDGLELVFEARDATPTAQNLHNDASTVNLLLNGNILTKEEKRQLLKDMGILDRENVPFPKDFDKKESPDLDEIPF